MYNRTKTKQLVFVNLELAMVVREGERGHCPSCSGVVLQSFQGIPLDRLKQEYRRLKIKMGKETIKL